MKDVTGRHGRRTERWMTGRTRLRGWLAGLVTVAVCGTAAVPGPAAAAPRHPEAVHAAAVAPAVPDWSVALVDSTMARYTPARLGGWDYIAGLYLYGQFLVYQRTHDPALLAYVRAWVDRFV